jgi:prephenate dehydrogenase
MRIAIIGAGHMGSWLARELSKGHDVAVYDLDLAKAQRAAAACKAAASPLARLEQLADFKPDILINAVSLQKTVNAFEAAAPHLPSGCILADVASVKGGISGYYGKCGFDFVSTHPMFGPTFANVEALGNENAVIIKESCKDGAEFFRAFFGKLGLHIFEYTFEEHDRVMAYSLTTPFASSMVFAACMDSQAVPGTTFRKHREIARGLLSEDDWLLAEILFNPNSLSQLENITARLEFLKHVIKGRDYDEAKGFFEKLRKNLR